MLIWTTMLVPIITAVILFQKMKHHVWWAFATPFVLTAVMAGGSKALVEHAQCRDMEYWTGAATVAEYYEDWNERVSCRHPKYKRDRKGNSVQDGYEHSYDVDYHPPVWQVTDTNKITVNIDSECFQRLCTKFGNKDFVNLHRRYHSKDGNLYRTNWSGDESRIEPIITQHSYENRIKAGSSVFKFQDVDPKTYHLFDYPKIHNFYEQPCILGNGGITQQVAEVQLSRWNAKLGPTRQCRIFILIFRDVPLQAGFEQECYWKGGNKNEFVVTIGVNKDDEIQWTHAFSWTEVETLKIETRDYINSLQKLNLEMIVKWLGPEVEKSFKRKHFKEFSYLTVEPPGWAICLVFVLTILVNIGTSVFFIKNEDSLSNRRY